MNPAEIGICVYLVACLVFVGINHRHKTVPVRVDTRHYLLLVLVSPFILILAGVLWLVEEPHRRQAARKIGRTGGRG